MTSRIDNLEIVFDRTDWNAFAKSHRALLSAILNAERLGHVKTTEGLHDLLNWITAVEDAARMDGYVVRHLTEEESTP